jgi:hypothetical protein
MSDDVHRKFSRSAITDIGKASNVAMASVKEERSLTGEEALQMTPLLAHAVASLLDGPAYLREPQNPSEAEVVRAFNEAAMNFVVEFDDDFRDLR